MAAITSLTPARISKVKVTIIRTEGTMYASSTESIAFWVLALTITLSPILTFSSGFSAVMLFKAISDMPHAPLAWHPAQAVWLCMVTIIKLSATCVTIPSCSIVFFAII